MFYHINRIFLQVFFTIKPILLVWCTITLPFMYLSIWEPLKYIMPMCISNTNTILQKVYLNTIKYKYFLFDPKSGVYQCLLLVNPVYSCLPMFIHVYLCYLFTLVYLCSAPLCWASLSMFIPLYLSLPTFTRVNLFACVYLFTRVYLCLLVFVYV